MAVHRTDLTPDHSRGIRGTRGLARGEDFLHRALYDDSREAEISEVRGGLVSGLHRDASALSAHSVARFRLFSRRIRISLTQVIEQRP